MKGSLSEDTKCQGATYGKRAGGNARGSEAGDGTSDDKDGGPRGSRTDDGADLEDHERGDEDPFEIELGEQLAEHQLETAGREEVGRTVPAHVRKRVELGGDLGDGGCDD